MDLAGLNIVMDADFEPVYAAFTQAKSMAQSFAGDIKNALNGIPDLGRKLNFTSNGASQAAQDAREAARAAREQAAADLDRARASDIADRAQQRASRTNSTAKDEFAQLVAGNQALVREYYNAAASVIRYGDAAGISADRLEELRVAAQRGQQQLSQIEQGAGRFQRQVGNYAVGTAALSQQLRQITTEIPNFFISARIGFQSLSNNLPGIFNELTRLREANVQLAASGQPTVSIFKQFLSAFNPLNIAIGVGVGLLTAYGPELLAVAKGWFAGSQAAQQQAANIKELDEATKKISKTATEAAYKEVGNAKLLYAVTQDVTLSYEERRKAAKQLIDLAPNVFKNLNDEAIVAGRAEQAYLNLVKAIKEKIALAVNEEQVTILFKQAQQAENYYKALQLAKQATKELQTAQEDAVSGNSSGAAKQVKIQNKLRQDLLKLGVTVPIDPTEKNITEAAKNVLIANTAFDEAVKETTNIKGRLDKLFEKPVKPPKQKDIATELIKAQQDVIVAWYNIQQADAKGFDAFAKNHDLTNKELKPLYIPDGSGEITAYFDENAKAIQKGVDDEAAILNTQAGVWEDSNKDLLDYLNKRQQIIQKNKPQEILRQFQLEALEVAQGFSASIAQAIFNVTVGAAEALGEALGRIGEEGNFENLFKNIGSIIGDQIIALGKQLVIAGGLMEAIWAAIESIGIPTGGAGAIIVGLAAIAGGAALKAALSRDAGKVGKLPLAAGAMVYGPTNALIGEYANSRSNPEVVAPLDKLQTILKNSGGGNREPLVIIPNVVLKGSDIHLSFTRAEKALKR